VARRTGETFQNPMRPHKPKLLVSLLVGALLLAPTATFAGDEAFKLKRSTLFVQSHAQSSARSSLEPAAAPSEKLSKTAQLAASEQHNSDLVPTRAHRSDDAGESNAPALDNNDLLAAEPPEKEAGEPIWRSGWFWGAATVVLVTAAAFTAFAIAQDDRIPKTSLGNMEAFR